MSELRNGQFLRSERGDTSATSSGTWVEFFLDTVEDDLASQSAGRPVYRDEERVRYYFPGNPQNRPVFKATPAEQQKWPKEYAAFKAGIEISVDGVPLEQWPVLRKSQVLELKAMGFKTVEQVSLMDDLAIQRVGMGARQLKGLADAYLDDAAAGALLAKTTAENERLNSQNAELKNKVTELSTLLNDEHSRRMALQNAPSPLATAIPGMSDPMEAMRMAQPQDAVAQSSLAALAAPRRGPGRPRKDAA